MFSVYSQETLARIDTKSSVYFGQPAATDTALVCNKDRPYIFGSPQQQIQFWSVIKIVGRYLGSPQQQIQLWSVRKIVDMFLVYFVKGEPRNVEYCKVFLWKCNIWVLRTSKLPDANFFIHSILRN